MYAEPTSLTAKAGATVLYKDAYVRDDLGRIATLKETIGGKATTYSYKYDNAGRLVEVDSGTGKKGKVLASYTYDSNSNRLSVTNSSGTTTATYDAQDRLLTYGSASYTYTANGELASKTVGSAVTIYSYDSLGDLTSVTLPDGTQLSYIVDAEENRVGKKVNGALAAGFLYDGERLVAQLDANNQVVAQFVYGSGGVAPDYMIKGGLTYRIFADQLGSPRLVVDSASGNVLERIDYDEFGNVINDTNPGLQPFGFAGGLYDADTKLLHIGARDYDSASGRWTTKDPIWFEGADSNLYGYVLSDPINLIDPTGFDAEKPHHVTVRNDVWGVNVFSEPCPCPLDHGVRWFKNEGWTTMVVVGTKRVRGSHWVFSVIKEIPSPKPCTHSNLTPEEHDRVDQKILKDVRDRRERQIRDWREVPAQRSWWD